jgi:hypothetical protein
MQTHSDSQHSRFIDRLRERAEKAQRASASTIAAGKGNEPPLVSWKGANGFHCARLPEDEQGILRLSIGGGDHLPVTLNYLTYRGDTGQCIALLEKALAALRECPE